MMATEVKTALALGDIVTWSVPAKKFLGITWRKARTETMVITHVGVGSAPDELVKEK